jgi:hypothetical protein
VTEKTQLGRGKRLCLRFGRDTPEVIRSRIGYAFRIFAAIYSYEVVDACEAGDVCCVYGGQPPLIRTPGERFIPARYRTEPANTPAPSLVQHSYSDRKIPLAYGLDPVTGSPDWLGEIFEWVSGSFERGITARDSVGRIPFSGTVFARQSLSPRRPYAAMVMAWLEHQICHGAREPGFTKPPFPVPGAAHVVACTHDIDYYYAGKGLTFKRLLKNLGVAVLNYRSPSFFAASCRLLGAAVRNEKVGDYLPALTHSLEERGATSSLFVVADRGHRRDPNYELSQIGGTLAAAAEKGFCIELHGSYNSGLKAACLNSEAAALERAVGRRVLGNRQHWLRFRSHQQLFEAIERAGLVFDSTLGFAETVGFRNGACFPFPPYNFEQERPHKFLEVPLALMDGSLEAAARSTGERSQAIAEEVLNESRNWAWGGIAALWHNPIEPIQVPDEINQVFWDCLGKRKPPTEKWMSTTDLLKCVLPNFHHAGLLKGVGLDAEPALGEKSSHRGSESRDSDRVQSADVITHSAR